MGNEESDARSHTDCAHDDIERLMRDWPHCAGCGVQLWSEYVRASGILEKHAEGCPHAERDALARDARVADYERLNAMRSELLQAMRSARSYARELAATIDEIESAIDKGRPFVPFADRARGDHG